jgi:hypothetical protein
MSFWGAKTVKIGKINRLCGGEAQFRHELLTELPDFPCIESHFGNWAILSLFGVKINNVGRIGNLGRPKTESSRHLLPELPNFPCIGREILTKRRK